MSAYDKKYFTLDGGLSYKTLLSHFKRQAEGGSNGVMLINNSQGTLKSNLSGITNQASLVLVDLASDHEGEKDDDMPKVEVVMPTEASRRRALDQLAEEKADKKMAHLGAGAIKGLLQGKRGHSTGGAGKGNTTSAKAAKKKQTVKRTKKDLFD